MTKIRDIQRQIQKLYEGLGEPAYELPLPLRVKEFISFAKEYSAAATLIAEKAPQLMLARLQMTGQSVELALKACLAARGIEPPLDHDLVKLCESASSNGYCLSDFELAAVVHLSHFYHRDLETSTKFKLRYPTKRTERLGGAIPDKPLSLLLSVHYASKQSRSSRSSCPSYGSIGYHDA